MLLDLKNKKEREAFVKNYRSWDLWRDIPELGVIYFRYDFQNGAVLIVTEYKRFMKWKNEYQTENKYCLILPEGDNYVDKSSACGEVLHKTFTPDGCSMGTVVDYMTKNKGLI